MSGSLVPGLSTMIISFAPLPAARSGFGHKKTVPRLRDGWVSTFQASTHSPQTGPAKVKPIARLDRSVVLRDALHYERKHSKIRGGCQSGFEPSGERVAKASAREPFVLIETFNG